MNHLKEKKESYFQVDTGDEKLSFIKLCWPLVMEYILKYMLTTVNTLILSGYSDDAVAAVGVAGQVTNLNFVIQQALSAGAMVSISQNLGAGNKKRAKNLASVVLAMTVGVTALFTLLATLFPMQILRIMNLEERLLKEGADYLAIVGTVAILESLIAIISAIVRCYGYTKIPMVIITVMNLINAIGSYIVIERPFEVPVYGVQGVAIARAISVVASFILALFIIRKVPLGLSFSAFKKENEPGANVKILLKIGVPSGLSSFSYNFSQLIATSILADMGSASVSAMVYVKNIVQYVAICSMAISAAYQIIVGRVIGMGKKAYAKALGNMNFVLCAAFNTIVILTIVLFRRPLVAMFTESPQIMGLAVNVIVIDIVVEFFRAMNHAGSANLAASGDVKYHMIIGIVSCWVFSVAFSYIFGVVLELGIYGCWMAFCLDEGFRAISYCRRWQSGKWERFAVVKRDVQ